MNNNTYQRCYHTHPALPLKDGLVIYGGSCSDPAVKDADIYVGFDYSMPARSMAYPWNPGVWFNFPITDMKAPSNPEEFSKFIDWLILQLSANKKVHIGCIGGHGRTGTVLAALVARFLGVADAITYVREKYCQKAVESQVQIDFLAKHFGVIPAAPSKAHGAFQGHSHGGTSQSESFNAKYGSRVPYVRDKFKATEPVAEAPKKTKAKMVITASFRPSKVKSVPSLWGPTVNLQGKLL